MRHPRVRFKLSQTAEMRVIRGFIRDAKYDSGRNLARGVYRHHPSLRPVIEHGRRLPIAEVQRYVGRVYAGNITIFRDFAGAVERQWRKKESKFFMMVKDEFTCERWPKGKYVAYFTIWSVFPKFLDDKTFCVPFHHRRDGYINVIIAHEMLHFAFYSHFYRWYPQYRSSKYNAFVWNVAELFNVVIQNSKRWTGVFHRQTMHDPRHEKMLRGIRKKIRGMDARAKDLTKVIVEIVERQPQFKNIHGLRRRSIRRRQAGIRGKPNGLRLGSPLFRSTSDRKNGDVASQAPTRDSVFKSRSAPLHRA